MKICSWNLKHRTGASVEDIADVLESEKPDLLLMQETVPEIAGLKQAIGGSFLFHPWQGKRYGMAIWSPGRLMARESIDLPFSRLPGSFPKRTAQVVNLNEVIIANVHLSHGQLLNRRQLSRIANSTKGPTVIIGDFNVVGPTVLKDFRDVGPKATTHKAQNLLPFRLDRCLVRDMRCVDAKRLSRGNSDHHPIVVSLETT